MFAILFQSRLQRKLLNKASTPLNCRLALALLLTFCWWAVVGGGSWLLVHGVLEETRETWVALCGWGRGGDHFLKKIRMFSFGSTFFPKFRFFPKPTFMHSFSSSGVHLRHGCPPAGPFPASILQSWQDPPPQPCWPSQEAHRPTRGELGSLTLGTRAAFPRAPRAAAAARARLRRPPQQPE